MPRRANDPPPKRNRANEFPLDYEPPMPHWIDERIEEAKDGHTNCEAVIVLGIACKFLLKFYEVQKHG